MKTIFECRAGSHLYGTNTDHSDIDVRGVFIPDKKYFLGFLHKIEQIENKKNDTTHFDIRKFFALCIDSNPNIVEFLFVPKKLATIWTEEWEKIIDNKNLFISRKARYTFSGYAVSQLKRIESHRSWLLKPPKKQPERSDFGLPNDRKLVTQEQIIAHEKLQAWAKDTTGFELNNDELTNLMDDRVIEALNREKAFQNANKEWGQYLEWKKNRNPKRAELEIKYGYDTKHAGHLYRLVTEGKELLLTGEIIFPRPDANIILDIRNGKYTYDEMMSVVGDIDEQFNKFYENSILPNKPNVNKADELCIDLVQDILFNLNSEDV